MSKYQRPLRGIRDEVFDAELTYPQRETLATAYRDFWDSLEEETQEELDSMLM